MMGWITLISTPKKGHQRVRKDNKLTVDAWTGTFSLSKKFTMAG